MKGIKNEIGYVSQRLKEFGVQVVLRQAQEPSLNDRGSKKELVYVFSMFMLILTSCKGDVNSNGIESQFDRLKDNNYDIFKSWNILRRETNKRPNEFGVALFNFHFDTINFCNDTNCQITFLVQKSIDSTTIALSKSDLKKYAFSKNIKNLDRAELKIQNIVDTFFSLKINGITYLPYHEGCFSIILDQNRALYYDPQKKCRKLITESKIFLNKSWFYIEN
jgi:hypothetical protein